MEENGRLQASDKITIADLDSGNLIDTLIPLPSSLSLVCSEHGAAFCSTTGKSVGAPSNRRCRGLA